MTYFYATLGIVFGILFPFMVFAVLYSIAMWYQIRREEQEEWDYKKWFLGREWNLLGSKNPSNPDYVTLCFRNGKTDEVLDISVQRSQLLAYSRHPKSNGSSPVEDSANFSAGYRVAMQAVSDIIQRAAYAASERSQSGQGNSCDKSVSVALFGVLNDMNFLRNPPPASKTEG